MEKKEDLPLDFKECEPGTQSIFQVYEQYEEYDEIKELIEILIAINSETQSYYTST